MIQYLDRQSPDRPCKSTKEIKKLKEFSQHDKHIVTPTTTVMPRFYSNETQMGQFFNRSWILEKTVFSLVSESDVQHRYEQHLLDFALAQQKGMMCIVDVNAPFLYDKRV